MPTSTQESPTKDVLWSLFWYSRESCYDHLKNSITNMVLLCGIVTLPEVSQFFSSENQLKLSLFWNFHNFLRNTCDVCWCVMKPMLIHFSCSLIVQCSFQPVWIDGLFYTRRSWVASRDTKINTSAQFPPTWSRETNQYPKTEITFNCS